MRADRGSAGMRATVIALSVVVCAILPLMLTGGLAVQLRADLGMTSVQIGLASTFVFGAGALGSTAFGRLTEHVGASIALRLAAMLSVISMLGTALFADSGARFLAFLVIAGLANAVAHPAANLALVNAVRPSQQALVFGVKQSALPAAGLLTGVAVPTIALTVGWRYIFGIGAALAIALLFLTPFMVSSPHSPRLDRPAGRLSVPPRPMALLAVAAGLGAMATNSFGAFLVLSATRSGLSEGSAGLLLSVSSGAGIAIRIAVGWLADRTSAIGFSATSILMLAGAVGFALLAILAPVPAIVGSLLGFGLGWSWPGLFNFAVARVNPAAPAMATGVVQTGIHIGAAVGPPVFGVIATRASFAAAWLVASLVALAGSATMIIGRRAVLQGLASTGDHGEPGMSGAAEIRRAGPRRPSRPPHRPV